MEAVETPGSDSVALKKSNGESKSSAHAGLEVKRHFTKEWLHPFDTVGWKVTDAVIVGADGVEKFRQDGVEVPDWWTDTQVNVVAEKYFRVVEGRKEMSAKQMFGRVAEWLMARGVEQGVFDVTNGAIFRDELLYMGVHGMHAFNSPVWFNVGAVEHPQSSACFIQGVADTMDSIMDLAKREVMLFKGGSGTGSNLSKLRSSYERLSRGGRSSGPVSFMRGYDAFAGATKSGGGTRRAAKLNCLNIDHPDILDQRDGSPGFIKCKSHAEKMAHDLYETGKYSAEWNLPGNVYDLVGFQNANNSVRVTDEFMHAVELDADWTTKEVSTGTPVKTYKARELWREISEATWISGDPGVQFDTTTNEWHTVKASGRINASNPCSEYLHLDDSACNLSCLNVLRFAKSSKTFDVPGFVHAAEIAIIAKEIIVDGSSYPSPTIADNSHKFRPLGLGYTNLGALLTYYGLPYDSDRGRAVAGAITAIMGGAAQRMSAELAHVRGPFEGYAINAEHVLTVVQKHWDAAKRLPVSTLGATWAMLGDAAYELWRDALKQGQLHGYRNSQVTLLMPAGTCGYIMGADTTGLEPMLGCVVFKKIVGEGLLKLPNAVVEPALMNLGYEPDAVESILAYVKKTGDIHSAPDFDERRHGSIFAEALGPHAIKSEGHVDMMIATQPFLSGGISKTVNAPATCTPEDISKIYMRAWKGGVKCIAVYRDGCKLSQPISTSLTDKSGFATDKLGWGARRRLPTTRKSETHKFSVGSQEGYVTAGFYPDGKVGEIFINIAKAGSTLNGILDAWATSVSVGLQHGVPLETFIDKGIDMRFEPAGITENPDIRFAQSLVDYIFRWMKMSYVDKVQLSLLDEKPTQVEVVEMPVSKVVAASLDGPPCSRCGNMTRRAGSCYCCIACGTTTGCS